MTPAAREASAAAFLTLLWTEQPPGLIEMWTKDGKKSQYLRSPLGAGVVASPGRPDVYTGVCLAYKDPGRSRRARSEQRVAMTGLWLDIDVCGGPDRKTGVAPDKAAAIDIASRLHEPTLIVDSGYGIHAWWLFERPWGFTSKADQDAAQRAAAQWYALHRRIANEHGWSIDHTHDLARLLRIPGTVNAKDPDRPRTVALVRDDGLRYPREQLLEHAAAAGDVGLTAAARSGPVQFVLRTNAELEQEILDALELNAPEFHAALVHHDADTRGWSDTSLSTWDLSLATQAARAGWTDQRIADVLVWHRERWNPGDPKAGRPDYIRRTIALARGRARRGAAADTLRELAAKAA